MLTFELESEVIRQMPTFVIASKQEQCIRVPDLESPDVQNALQGTKRHG